MLDDPDDAAASIAAAIGEPARARMLYCLIDGRARTSTELAAVADVTPSTASVHLRRLQTERLVKVFAQGKHRYYSLERADVAAALEALSVLAGGSGGRLIVPHAARLRAARTCYDHIAGTLGVALHDRFVALAGSRTEPTATSPTTSRRRASPGLRRLAWTSRRREPCAGGWRSPASTGASARRIWAARSGRHCFIWRSARVGEPRSRQPDADADEPWSTRPPRGGGSGSSSLKSAVW